MISILVDVNYILIGIALLLFVCFLLQFIFSKISCFWGWYIPTENSFREDLKHIVIKLFVKISIYIVSIGIFSDLLLNYGKPLEVINTTNARFVSITPFVIMIFFIIIGMIFPRTLDSYYIEN